MEITLWYIILSALFILILKYFLANTQKPNNNPPSPPSLPLIGHLHLVKEPLHRNLQALSEKYGNILQLQLGFRKVLLIDSPSAVEECFTRNDIVFATRPFTLATKHFSYDFTTISVAPYGDHWRNLRRLAALEIFSTARISMFEKVRTKELMILLSELFRNSKLDGGSTKVDLNSKFTDIVFNVLSMTIAGKRYYGENVVDARKVRFIMREMVEYSGNRNLGDLFPFLQWVDFQGSELSEKTMIDQLLVLQENEPEYYTDKLIKGITLVLLVAGADTMSVTMEWAMSLILNHPDKIKKIKAEIDAHVPEDRLINEQDLPKLNYLQNAITETLRLYPPLPFLIPHEASDDCRVGGYDVSKGTMLLVNLWSIHRNPRLWEDPDKFMPERHEFKEDGLFMMPFGAGRRKCPGGGLSTRVIGLTLGALIQCFEWERVGDELVDMTENTGFSIPKVEPLVAMCKPRDVVTKYSLIVA
ncbi:hypothetical protein DH2020_027405 [Rehmannia glutinosa]|uniref:Uncharacterized protein n=1 Tax=Rehmannia glutinosa TaxID=99300 RepID=A0ABR0VY42_REHGL